jgi:acyl carrier protein
MDAQSIYDRMALVFREVFDDDGLVLTPAMTAKDVAEWDSLNHIRLVVAIEAEFKIRFTAGEISDLENVGELVALIQRKI